MISIIIPTLNEEKYLPLLLSSIKKQNFNDYEIIIADAGSDDKTLEIVKNYNCKIVEGGLPAKARNNGAKVAKGDILFFLDADVILPENFLEKTLKEFKKRALKITSFRIDFLPQNKFSSFFVNTFYNKPIILLENILPHTATAILVEKKIFDKLDGFDENIKLAEDHDFGRRAAKLAKFGIIKSTKIFVSDRRFKRDGWIKTSMRYFLCELHMIFIGPVKSDIFKYKFNHYKDNSKSKSQN